MIVNGVHPLVMTNIAIEIIEHGTFSSLIILLRMVIFYSYVSLPKGILCTYTVYDLANCLFPIYVHIHMYTYIVIVSIGDFFGKKDNATPNECIIISCFFLHPLVCSRRNQPFLDLNGGICIYIYTYSIYIHISIYIYIHTYVIYILCLWICLTWYQDRPMGHYVSPSEGDKPVQVMKFGGISRWKNRAKQICCGIDCKVSFIIQTHIYIYIYTQTISNHSPHISWGSRRHHPSHGPPGSAGSPF